MGSVDRSRLVPRLPLLIGLVAVGLLIFFDLGPALPFNDDAVYTYPVSQLAHGHGFRIYPQQRAAALVGQFWGLVGTLGHPDPVLLRLTLVPFVVLTAVKSYQLARLFGADRFWSHTCGVTLLGFPIYLALATSFMTDVVYLSLVVSAVVAAVRWLTRGQSKLEFIAWATLAALQRQQAIVILAAFALSFFLARRHRVISRRDWLHFDLAIVVVAAAELLPVFSGLLAWNLSANLATFGIGHAGVAPGPPPASAPGAALLHLLPLVYAATLMGLLLTPMLAGLTHAARRSKPASARRHAMAWIAGALVILAAVFLQLKVGTIFPGDYLNPQGLGPPHVAGLLNGAGPGVAGLDNTPGDKPQIFPTPLWLLIELLAVVTFVALVLWPGKATMRMAQPLGTSTGVAVAFIAMVSIGHLAIVVLGTDVDRYFLPVAVPLLPLVAAHVSASAPARSARAWAMAAVCAGLLIYGIGQQDYESWQQARDTAARRAYQLAPPSQVDAGYEANLRYYALPLFDSGVVVGPDIPDARYRILFARQDDPRPGVDYSSLAPGRLVISATAH